MIAVNGVQLFPVLFAFCNFA